MNAASHDSNAERPIAVVTVCRNDLANLRNAVASVQALADPRVRHIVVDGASTDGTPEWLAQAGASLFHWRSEPDGGIYDAMNKGWAAAPADAWILFIGADDRLLSLPAAAELRDAEAAQAGMVYGTTTRGTRPFRSRLDSTIRFRNTLHHQSLLVAKSASPQPPFDVRYAVCGDWDFNARLWRGGARAVFSPSLRAFASPAGVSARRPLRESFLIGWRHGGPLAALLAWSLALRGRVVEHRAGSQPGQAVLGDWRP